jgi:large subunit ribosomal protein L3
VESDFFIAKNMAKFILGKKLGMTTIYDKEKKAQNVTLVECLSNKISLLRTAEKDGYKSVQVEMPKTAKRMVRREFRVEELGENYAVGNEISIDQFEIGEKVKISGITKGKGFQGVVKRYGFKGAPKTHGHKHDLRAPGSIGATYPEHVVKGRRMAGRMGADRTTVKNVKVAYMDKEKNIIGVKGAVPGIPGGIVEIRG